MPAVSHLLENFTPYRSYVEALRELEREYEHGGQSDLARHAFYDLRFGTNLAPESIKQKVKGVLAEIKSKIEDLKIKSKIEDLEEERPHNLISLDIGMRGVVCCIRESTLLLRQSGVASVCRVVHTGTEPVV